MSLKAFDKNGLRYRPIQQVNGGTQWRCDYEDGQFSIAMVYSKKPTRDNVIAAIEDINIKNDHE